MMTLRQHNYLTLCLRAGLGAVWFWSAIVSEFIAPRELSLGLLAAVGISGALAPVMLHGASLLDAILGVLTLAGVCTRWVAIAQAMLVLVYSGLLVGRVPELWIHPFAPIGKNIALIATALALAISGGGDWSVDRLLRRSAVRWLERA